MATVEVLETVDSAQVVVEITTAGPQGAAGTDVEAVQDAAAALFTVGGHKGITPVYNDSLNRIELSATGFTFTQSTPSTLWIINHNFGYYPTSVDVYNSGSQRVWPEVTQPTINQTRISFTIATAGFAKVI
jgi:hypothetical protein